MMQSEEGNKGNMRDAWAYVVHRNPQWAKLNALVRGTLSFFLTETECERNFSVEKQQYFISVNVRVV